jgi:hypothetical protein
MSFGTTPARRVSLILVSLAILLASFLLTGRRATVQALDLASLANCALPAHLQLNARIGDAPSTHSLYVGNDFTPGCSVTTTEPFVATVSYLNGGTNWLALAPASGSLQPNQRNSIRVTFTPGSLPRVGTYQAFINIRLTGPNGTISIPVSAALTAPSPQLSLSWSSMVFQTVTRTGVPAPQIVLLVNSGTGTMDWSVDAASVPAWLNVSPRAGVYSATDPAGTVITVGPNTAALDPGVYTALIPFRSTTARNSPQYLSVTYHVVAPTAGPIPLLSAYGMNFSAVAGSTNNM